VVASVAIPVGTITPALWMAASAKSSAKRA
jgi:hypothetical protein